MAFDGTEVILNCSVEFLVWINKENEPIFDFIPNILSMKLALELVNMCKVLSEPLNISIVFTPVRSHLWQ